MDVQVYSHCLALCCYLNPFVNPCACKMIIRSARAVVHLEPVQCGSSRRAHVSQARWGGLGLSCLHMNFKIRLAAF